MAEIFALGGRCMNLIESAIDGLSLGGLKEGLQVGFELDR